MDHISILSETANTLEERTKLYGSPKRTYEDAAKIASTIIKKDLTAYDLAMIMVAVKLSRTVTGRDHLDNYQDAINFLAFAGEFATAPLDPETADDLADTMKTWRKRHAVSSAQYAGRMPDPHVVVTNVAEQEADGNDP